MIEVVLHAIIDDFRGNENKVFQITEEEEMRWWRRASFWITFSKIGLPVAYMMATLALVVPGVINVVVEGSW